MADFASPYGFNLAAIDQANSARKSNALREMLLDRQIKAQDQEIEADNALAEIYRPQLRTMGLPENAVAKVSGKGAQAYVKDLSDRQKAMRDQAAKEAPIFGRLFSGVQDQDSYTKAIESGAQFGLDMSKLPMQYDPRVVGKIVAASQAFDPEKFDTREAATGFVQIGDRGSVRPVTGAQPYRAPESPVEYYDPNSPTGTRLGTRQQAMGQPGRPGSGLQFRTNPDGTVELIQGKGVGMGAFGQTGTNKLDEAIIGNANRLARVYDIAGAYKPEYLTLGNQISNFTSAWQERLVPGSLSPESQQQLAAYTDFRSKAYNDLNQTLKEMSGAAITPQEADRLLKVLGDPQNDSPTQFKAKLDSIMRDVRMSQARLLYLRQTGPDGAKKINDIGLSDMPKVIKEREGALIRQAKEQNPGISDDQLKQTVRDGLRKEFGL